MINANQTDTIAAIATAPGKGALGIIRVSGTKAFEIVNSIFTGKDLKKVATQTIHYGFIKDKETVVDEVLVSVFKNPGSYTGEDLIEISCHGSLFILNEMMNLLLKKGAKQASAGEFTLRAFLNKKLDLSQAEAVVDVIDSETKASHKIAINQMRGGFSERIKLLRTKLLDLSTLFELELDFAEEDVEFATNEQLSNILIEIKKEVAVMVDSFKLGNVLKQGVSVVIAGRPNAGKSTLLNSLLEDERAITSHIPGTTRDFIEDVINIDGILFRFVDTAGLTQSENEIEKIGIARTLEKINKADIIIYLFDVTELSSEDVKEDIKQLQLKSKFVIVANKFDKINKEKIGEIKKKYKSIDKDVVFISSKFQKNITELKKTLIKKLDVEKYEGDFSVVTNTRHYKILIDILKSIKDIDTAIENSVSKDFISIDIRSILQQMGEITGEITNDEILGNIFGRFCIGK